MDGPYEAISFSSLAFSPRTVYNVVLIDAMNDYASLVREQHVPDCRICQKQYADSLSCVEPANAARMVASMAEYHGSHHRGEIAYILFREPRQEAA